MSYIEGSVEILKNTTFEPFIRKAQFKFYLELVFPIVQVFDANQMKSEFFKMKQIIHGIQFNQTGIRAVRLETQYGILQLTFLQVFSSSTLSFLPKPQAEKVIDAVMARSQQQYADQQNPYPFKPAKQNLPQKEIAMDFQAQFDAQFAVQVEGQEYKRMCGYACVSIADAQEATQKLGVKQPHLVFDSEYSGVFLQQISLQNEYSFIVEEHQFDCIIGDVAVSLQIEEEAQYQKFQQVFNQIIQKLHEQEHHAVEDIAYVESQSFRGLGLTQLFDDQQEVEDGPKFKKNVKNVEIRSKAAISSIDDLVFMFSSGLQAEIFIKDAQKQSFSGTFKLDADQKNMLASDQQKLLLFDTQKQMTTQELIHYVQGTQTVTTKFLDFTAGDEQKSILGAQIPFQQAIVGISSNSLFLMDKRLENKKNSVFEAVQKAGNSYKHVLISKNGSVIIANQQGEIYIFNKQTQRATNKLPGTGFNPVGMCLSEGEEYLIVTFDTFVLLHQLQVEAGHFLEQQIKVTDRKKPIWCKIDLEEIIKLGLNKFPLKPAFVSKGFVVSASKKFVLLWQLDELIKGNTKVLKKAVQHSVVGLGSLNNKCTVAFESGWGWFQ